jgi:hypothetical protein
MNDKKTRIILFFFVCMVVRIGLILLAKYLNTKYLPYMGLVTLIMGLGFTYIYLFGHFKSNPNVGGFGGSVWWNNLRIVHGLLYISFSVIALLTLNKKFKDNKAWVILAVDILIGFISFVNKYFL